MRLLNDDFISSYIQKCKQELESKLPEFSHSKIQVYEATQNSFKAKVRIKGLGKAIVAEETGDDCLQTIQTAKRKAIAKAQSFLRKKHKRWWRAPLYGSHTEQTAS